MTNSEIFLGQFIVRDCDMGVRFRGGVSMIKYLSGPDGNRTIMTMSWDSVQDISMENTQHDSWNINNLKSQARPMDYGYLRSISNIESAFRPAQLNDGEEISAMVRGIWTASVVEKTMHDGRVVIVRATEKGFYLAGIRYAVMSCQVKRLSDIGQEFTDMEVALE